MGGLVKVKPDTVRAVGYEGTRVIRIDDEVFALLQKNATALKDSPNAVIRRLLGLDKPEEK
jgi:hypothetical protein